MATAYINPDQQSIDRRRAIAMALQQASMQPLESPGVRGARISPLEGINKIAQALMADYQNKQLDQQQAALSGQQQQSRVAQALALSNAVTPQPQGLPAPMAQPQEAAIPGENAVPPISAPPVMTQLPVGPGQVQQRNASMSALAQALSSQNPDIVKSGQDVLQSQLIGNREQQTRTAEMAQAAAAQQHADEQARLSRIAENAKSQNMILNENQRAEEKIASEEKIAGMKPGAVQTEYDKKVEDFNKQADLVLKFGPGPTGYEKWLKSIPQTSGSGDQTTVTVIDDPNHPGQQMPVVVNKGNATGQVVTLSGGVQATKTPGAQIAADVKEAEDYKTSANSLSAMKTLASQKTYEADQAMGDQFFNVVKPGTGARMNGTQIDRFMTAGPLKEKMKVWAQKLDQGQPLTDAARKEMLDAAAAVVISKKPKATAPTPAGNVIHYDAQGNRLP
jgi:hypothetical protein